MIRLGDESLLNERTKSGVSAFSFAVYKAIATFDVANGLLDKGVKVGIKDMDWIIRNFDLNHPEVLTYDPLQRFQCFAAILRRLYEADPSMMEPYLKGKTSFTPWNDWINTTCRWYGPEKKTLPEVLILCH